MQPVSLSLLCVSTSRSQQQQQQRRMDNHATLPSPERRSSSEFPAEEAPSLHTSPTADAVLPPARTWHDRRQVLFTRVKYYVPVLSWLPTYNWRHSLLHDAVAGLTVALLMIPQSLSYASGLARLEPIYGLYASFTAVIIYGILGTSRQISVGPEALVCLFIGNAIEQTAGVSASIEERAGIAATLCLMVGLITFGLGLARLGFVDSVLSRALLRGFITAVACVILIEQLPSLLGIPHSPPTGNNEEHEPSPFQKLLVTLQHLDQTNWITATISAVSIAFLFGFARLKRWIADRMEQDQIRRDGGYSTPTRQHRNVIVRAWNQCLQWMSINNDAISHASLADLDPQQEGLLTATSDDQALPPPFATLPKPLPVYWRILFFVPEILIIVATTILFSFALNLSSDQYGVAILGPAALDGGFRLPRPPSLTAASLRALTTPAIMISVLGFVESIVVAKHYGSKYNYPVSANRELVAFGTMNLLGSLMNAFPMFASIARSRVNDTAGSRTQLAGVVTGCFILITILFILPIFYYLPKCVMASIVLVAAAGLLEMHDVHFMLKIRAWNDLALMVMTFMTTIFLSVEAGTLISIALSLVLVVKHSTTPKIAILGPVTESEGGATKIKYKPLEEIFPDPESRLPHDQEILIVKIEESLFFANTGQMKDRLGRAETFGGWLHVHPSESSRLERSPLRAVIFDIENMPKIDASAIQILIEIVEAYHHRGITVCFVKLRDANKAIFLRSGLLGDVVGSDHFFRKISDAMAFLRSLFIRCGVESPVNAYHNADVTTSSSDAPAAPKQDFSTHNLL